MPNRKISHFLKITGLTVLVCFSILFFSYHLAYAEKVIPGVKVVDIALGNKNQSEVNYILGKRFNERSSQLVKLTTADEDFEFSFEDLGLSYNREKTVASAFKVGRSGNLLEDLKIEFRAWFEGFEIEPILKVEDEKLGGVFLEIAEKLDDLPAEANFKIEGSELKIVEAKSGQVVNQDKLENKILTMLKGFSNTAVEIPLEDIIPEIMATDLETTRPQVEELLSNLVQLTYQSRSWTPTKEEVLSFLKFQKEDSTTSIVVEEDALANYIDGIASQVNREPRGDIFRAEGERVLEFRLATDGLKLDEVKAQKLLAEAILNSATQIELSVEVVQVPQSANEYGIKELLGQGVSNFAGSSQGRINNVKTASAKLQGLLIAPGETFSFNGALGEVTAATGYDTAWIIRQGRTVLGVGGGVCQVSTTVFRAAFNSGLEILQRTAHAYRVHYYEPPLGFDATVYSPSPDLVFKNDTAGHILVWSYVDVPNTILTFNFYGTSDGRSIKMIGPFVSGESPPPAPLYQDDASLAKGVTQQVDFAAWGATAVLKREVYRNGEVLHSNTFTSHYRPWQAVFLVGTRE